MRRLVFLLLFCLLCSTTAGCVTPIYSADPGRRARQLIHTSENFRALMDTWERFWFLDQPCHMTPIRTHGGII